MADPLVSVLTVVRNGEKTIGRCIESVLNQTYSSIEHIIVDGASTDGTLNILRGYGSQIGPWITEPDTGIYNAFNKGIRLVRGEYYLPLGCDDFLLPNAISDLSSKSGEGKIVMAKVLCRDHTGNQLKIYNHSAGALIPVNIHNKIGFYDESYKIAADTKLIESAKNINSVIYIDSVVGEFNLGGASSNYHETILEHARAMRESGSWNKIRSLLWIYPRLLYSKIKMLALYL